MEVELYDPKRSFVLNMFPLQPRIEAIIRHQSKRDQLIKCLHEDLPGMWSAMSVFGSGPTFMVFVRPFSVQNWNQLGKELSGIFASQEWKTNFVPGVVGRCKVEALRVFPDKEGARIASWTCSCLQFMKLLGVYQLPQAYHLRNILVLERLTWVKHRRGRQDRR